MSEKELDFSNLDDVEIPEYTKSDVKRLVNKVADDLLRPITELQNRCTTYEAFSGVVTLKSGIIDMHKEILKRLDEVVK